MTAITAAIKKMGKLANLAEAIGVTPQAVRKWKKENKGDSTIKRDEFIGSEKLFFSLLQEESKFLKKSRK